MKEADLKQQILIENPVPDNLDQLKNLYGFVHDILKDKRKQKDLEMDATFDKIRLKNTCVIDALSKLWMLVEEVHRSIKKADSPLIWIILEHILRKVLSLSQTSNYITYFRRYNILAAPNSPAQQLKEMLREEADLLQGMSEICLAKSLANTLWLHLNKKNRPLKYFLKRARKNKIPFGIPLQRYQGGFLEDSFEILLRKKDMGNRGKKYLMETTAQQWKTQWILR